MSPISAPPGKMPCARAAPVMVRASAAPARNAFNIGTSRFVGEGPLSLAQRRESIENGGFECDAVVGITMIGVEVDRDDLFAAGLLDGSHERFVEAAEAVVRGDKQDRAC